LPYTSNPLKQRKGIIKYNATKAPSPHPSPGGRGNKVPSPWKGRARERSEICDLTIN